MRHGLAAAGVLAAAAVTLTSCAGGTDTIAPSTTTAAPTTTTSAAPATPTVSEDQAQSLCTDLEAQLSNWRVQGPTVGRGGLNILVQTWAARYGLNAAVIQDRAIVDTAATDACSDVRSQVVDILEIPDLASGLVGL
ncbi:hypothetical protein HQ325_18535 [Rhodococcus sp. BP-349]|nr:hypothetical protein [Rhodococcus sp. BP-363]MBY6545305.1 hypothetical protein [Rhodococcus sp. BP-369]MBY6564535.1 hypothetical protein [Rhodococcus sp. BP-370]MBY6578529.1 hypothetical protein [Rhodococcus sp. BP-364]MBY6587830.1 hypothetical protein [Rhodococcus sp. BP-358]MBY6592167.1 hypothetical protein [Rhodococcus sp. BP-362]MBY6596802.1 hypothetical protein [Rhodococcus sp. BP-359]MBY6601141.1 hypothetical protein [Rhodococcus sp. BP-353]MBY6605180.1 hypothetical protein [Rhodoc